MSPTDSRIAPPPPARRRRIVLAWTLALALVSAARPALGAKDAGLPGKWVEARSDHFVLVSNVARKKAIKTLQSFERMRELVRGAYPAAANLDDPPLLVFAVKDVKSLVALLPSLADDPGRQLLRGLFFDLGPLPLVIVQTDYKSAHNFGAVFHEYYHYLVGRLGVDLPPWLSEGLADFWGAAVFTDEVTEIGRPQQERLLFVQNLDPIPLERFFAIQRTDPEFRRSDSVLLFYSQSWLVVHYLSIGVHDGERAPQLSRYLNLLASGRPSLDAARAAFGDLEVLERELKKYRQRLSLPVARYPATEAPAVETARVEEISPAEAAAWIGLAQLHVARVEDAEASVAAAREGAPDRMETHLASGLLAYRQGRWAEARASFDRAAEQSGDSALAAYGAGASRLRGETDATDLAEAERHLVRAIELDRLYAPAFQALAELYRRIDPDLRRASYFQSKAVSIRPQQEEYQVDRIALLFADDRAEEASAELTRRIEQAAAAEDLADLLILCTRGAVRGMAHRVLAACDQAVELVPEEARWSIADRRGLARALAGDLEGALEDFRASLAGGADIFPEGMTANRRLWIEALESGSDPFAGEGLAALLDDPQEFTGWGL